MITKIINGKVLINGKFTENNVYLTDNKISEITDQNLIYDKLIDAEGNYVTAGFIDMHCHGGGGADFSDGTVDSVITAAQTHLLHGTTSIFPTVTSSSFPETEQALIAIEQAKGKLASIRDAHLEGPYFSPAQMGAQNGEQLKAPNKTDYIKLIKNYKIARWDYAPERDCKHEFLKCLTENGIVAAAGHTDATIDQMYAAHLNGCNLITHLYSCTSTIRREKGFRIAGVTEAAYLYDGIYAEIIADGKHLPNQLIQFAYKFKGNGKLALITDAIRAAGTDIKETFTGKLNTGVKCIIEDGVAKLPDRSAFAGSVATADVLIKTALGAGISLPEAIKMLTEVPAEIMGLKNKGQIKCGYDADLVIFDRDINIKNVILNGNVVL